MVFAQADAKGHGVNKFYSVSMYDTQTESTYRMM